MIEAFNPSRRAMLIPADAPGTPILNSYVGCRVLSSNPTEAFTTPSVFAP